MSNYERNNTMVACIIAAIIVGAVGVGSIAMLGINNWAPTWNLGDWNPGDWNIGEWENTTTYEFSRTESSMPDEVAIGLEISTGGFDIIFTDDPDLVYEIAMVVPNRTVEQHGVPTVNYVDETVTLAYTTALVNVTLGNGTIYALDIDTTTGGVSLVLSSPGQVSDVDVDVTTGGIECVITDDVVFDGNVSIDLTATTGGIDLTVGLPTGIGGRLTTSVSTGPVDVTTTTWTEVTVDEVYETSDYDTATQVVQIAASTTTGGIQAVLS